MFDVIQEDLAALEPALEEAIVSETPLITDIGMHLVSSGGKRLRPALFLLAARGGASFDRARAMPVAVALELIHTASLVHDDVIDEADTRRDECEVGEPDCHPERRLYLCARVQARRGGGL